MTKIVVHDNFRVYNLRKFLASLSASTGNNKLYFGVGRPQPWPGVGDVETQPYNTIEDRNAVWEDMLSMKLLSEGDVSHAIVRETWKANTKYDQYRHDWGNATLRASSYFSSTFYPSSLADAKYYVINSQDDVFICLKQGLDGSMAVRASTFEPGIASSGSYISPISGGAGIFKCSDGYYWKYVANVSLNAAKFRTSTHQGVGVITTEPGPSTAAYSQWLSQLNSLNYKAGIYAINVLTKGTGYNGGSAGTSNQTSSAFKIVGNGSGLQFTVTYGAGGTVEDIEITNPGTGYTFAQIISTTGSGGVFDIIHTNPNGLGVDPVVDLSAIYLMVNTELDNTVTPELFYDNDFRKISLVMNPTQYASTSPATASVLDATTTLIMSGGGAGSYIADNTITNSAGAKGYIVQWILADNKLKIIKHRDLFDSGTIQNSNLNIQVGDSLAQSAGANLTVTSITNPTVQAFSGDVIYSENRIAVNRTADSTKENITVTIQF